MGLRLHASRRWVLGSSGWRTRRIPATINRRVEVRRVQLAAVLSLLPAASTGGRLVVTPK